MQSELGGKNNALRSAAHKAGLAQCAARCCDSRLVGVWLSLAFSSSFSRFFSSVLISALPSFSEPIHKIATRGVLFWREMDEKFFSITNKDALKAALIKNKSYIITRLNNDFQKPYCQTKQGEARHEWERGCMRRACSLRMFAARSSSSGSG